MATRAKHTKTRTDDSGRRMGSAGQGRIGPEMGVPGPPPPGSRQIDSFGRAGLSRNELDALRFPMVRKHGAYVIEVCTPQGERLPDMALDAFFAIFDKRAPTE